MSSPSRIAWLLAIATTMFHVLTSGRGGIFRDELYYLACSEHLGFGYVDQPPFAALVTWFARHVFGDSLHGLRLLPAVAAGATVLLTAAMTRRLGGGRYAQTLAAWLTALAPAYVSSFGYLSMNAFDVLFWAAALCVLIRILVDDTPRMWLVFGLIAGLGLQNKLSMAFLGIGVAAGLLLSRSWHHLRNRWLWLGGGVALLVFMPHVAWQAVHGWPVREFMANAMGEKNVALSPLGYLQMWAMQMNPAAVPVALAGLALLLVLPAGRPWRALGWASIVIVVLLMSQRTKPYYLSPLYTLLFASGSVVLARVAARPRWGWLRAATVALCGASAIPVAPFAKPLLASEDYVAYSARLGIAPRAEENHDMGRLPQFFADRIGWPELAATVAQVFATLTPEEREHACIFGHNYGQAGAIDFYGPALGLPKAISGHNSYFLWGPRGCRGDVVVVIDGDRDDLEEVFESVALATVYTCQDCMPYENDKPIWVCRRLRLPFESLWPRVRSYG